MLKSIILIRIILLFVTAIFLIACASNEKTEKPSYWDLPTSSVMPNTVEEKYAECGRIRDEIARQQTKADAANTMFSPRFAMMVRGKARENIAELSSRAAKIRCHAAFSNTAAPETKRRMEFDQCFEKCREHTSRTKEQCFDACNK